MAIGRRGEKTVLLTVVLLMLVVVTAGAQPKEAQDLSKIIINLPSRTIEFYVNNTVVKEYPVGIGKPSMPTPTGNFSIIEKEVDPWWYPPGKGHVVPSGPDNPLGCRWMGFAPLYGIHGTNAPWSIGRAASNGCVRMQEANVKELFELVDYDIPVTVTYDRIKVRVDARGRASIGVYPDVYGRQRVTLADVKQTLASQGLDGLAEDNFLLSVINNAADRQVMFAQLHNLKIDGVMRSERVVTWQGKKYVPVQAVADSLNTKVIWDEKTQRVIRQNHAAPGIKRGNSVYIAIDNLAALFSGRQEWNEQENCLELKVPIAKYDGQIVSSDIKFVADQLAVPALAVAKALGERVKWQSADQKLLFHGKAVPVTIVEDQPFIKVSDIGTVFNTAVAWDEQTQVINLTYPLYQVDYSMYLDVSDEFL